MQISILLFFLVASFSEHSQSKSYMFVFLHKRTSAPEVAKDSIEKLMKGHLANIERLANEEKLLAAGPFDGGGGMFVLNTTSEAEAEQWLSTDPGIQANRWDIEMLLYSPQVNGICKAQEPYQMVSYDFIRFYQSPDLNARVSQRHQQLVNEEAKKGNVITMGTFTSSGFIVILKEEATDKFLESNSIVQPAGSRTEKKKLWIAKGSFCEK
jgi:uncharacterized protein YciI